MPMTPIQLTVPRSVHYAVILLLLIVLPLIGVLTVEVRGLKLGLTKQQTMFAGAIEEQTVSNRLNSLLLADRWTGSMAAEDKLIIYKALKRRIPDLTREELGSVGDIQEQYLLGRLTAIRKEVRDEHNAKFEAEQQQ
jgi:hypothetical protein